jgi:hypothetical protein
VSVPFGDVLPGAVGVQQNAGAAHGRPACVLEAACAIRDEA